MKAINKDKKHVNKPRCTLGILAGKGGVGKSTLTAQLAQALDRSGYKVGVFDADIYGPSIRHLLPEQSEPQVEGDKVRPAQSAGISLMSMAHFPEDKMSSLVRAPIANQIISQFIEEVEWGELDFLLVDFPPGTGDIHLTLMQKMYFNGAVVVTTPEELSLLDVKKSMKMCIQMGVFLIGVVENMSYFSEPGSSKRHFIFGRGGGKALADMFNIPLLAKIPLDPCLSSKQNSDASSPIFDALSTKVLTLLEEEKGCEIKVNDRYHFSIKWLDGKESLYRFSDVQLHCPCVECMKKKSASEGVSAEEITCVGRYGIRILFSSGCSKGIYPFSLLRDLDR